MTEQVPPPVARFGVFEANLRSGELRKYGLLIRMPGQPFRILTILLERAGEVIPREELRRRLWAAETFVDFEHSLNSAVKKLREALGDSAEAPRYIETLPRQGYRFIAPVSFDNSQAVSPATVQAIPGPAAQAVPAPAVAPVAHPLELPSRRARRSWMKYVAAAGAILATSAAVWFGLRNPRSPLAERDSIILADFENRTGDPNFDGTLKNALEVDLNQSPYFNVLPDQTVRQTLASMRRRPEERITRQMGLEICQRNAAKAMLSSSIASLGDRYVLTLEAWNCTNGAMLAGVTAEAENKGKVLRALDDATAKVRRRLGESLGSIQKFGVPIEQATTGSLDALKMFAMGDDLRRQGKLAETIPFFQRATEFDPQFTLAYARLGAVYANLDESESARRYIEKAFQLRERTSERERLYLTARYYESVSGEAGKLVDNYEIWRNAYPGDWIPINNLGNEYTKLGQYQKAIEAGREALKLNPNHSFPYTVLARAYKRATRYTESKSVCAAAVAKHLDTYGLHNILYQIAFAEGDAESMRRQVEWGMGKPTEDETLAQEAWAAATSGRVRDARALFERAFEVARKNGLPDNAAAATVYQAWMEAIVHDFRAAREHAVAALAVKGANVSAEAALVLASAGELAKAESLAADIGRRFPLDTLVNEVSIPRIRAVAEIRRGQPTRAVDLLRRAAPFELGDFTVPYIRGRAYLAAGMGMDAAREFEKVLKNQGVDPTSPYYPLAHIGMAEAYALQADPAASRREYEAFFQLWKDADKEVPIFKEARSTYSDLARTHGPRLQH